jgi:L-gulonolactone oxidase
MPYEAAFREVEAALGELDGRPHWGKRSFLDDYATRYPRWADFQRVRAALDPGGRFANAWVRDILGG